MKKHDENSETAMYFIFYNIVEYLHEPFLKRVARAYIKDLQRIILNAPALPNDLYVFRGVRDSYHQTGAVKGRFDNLGFVSVSLDVNVARFFTKYGFQTNCCIQRILLPAGLHVLAVLGFSHYNDQAEVVLPDGVQFDLVNGRKTLYHQSEIEECFDKMPMYEVTDITVHRDLKKHSYMRSHSRSSPS
jgi:hypothetical protein